MLEQGVEGQAFLVTSHSIRFTIIPLKMDRIYAQKNGAGNWKMNGSRY